MPPEVAFLVNSLAAGGAEGVVCTLANALHGDGARSRVLAWTPEGPLCDRLDPGIALEGLPAGGGLHDWLPYLLASRRTFWPLLRAVVGGKGTRRLGQRPALVERLRGDPPLALYATSPYTNVQAVLAARMAGASTRVVVSEHSAPSLRWNARKVALLAPLQRAAYDMADAVVAVSVGVADDLARVTGLERRKITVIYNPAIGPDFAARAAEPVDDPWFDGQGPPVVVAVARSHPVKDLPTLLRAFARLRAGRLARLVLVGPGARDGEWEAVAAGLGFGADFRHLGYRPNPLPLVRAASLLVCSSRSEAFGNVLVEALALGTPVVSTDCPFGPAEILDGGRFGRLVPVGDDEALAAAMAATLDDPPSPERLRSRAAVFDGAVSLRAYRAVFGLS
ncbi:MAG: glycosyltransferase [Geminicoccaceae bacterium]|nr:glycosyltransferase [Geminicoccaceae bacterium]